VRAARVRVLIEQIIGGLQGGYAAGVVAKALQSGAAAAAAAETAQEGITGPLRALSKDSSASNNALTRTNSLQASNMSKQLRYGF
jgi:vacuolar protein sorting-associated protein 54